MENLDSVFEDKDKNPLNIFKINKKEYIECELNIDRAFIYKEFVTYKIKNIKLNYFSVYKFIFLRNSILCL